MASDKKDSREAAPKRTFNKVKPFNKDDKKRSFSKSDKPAYASKGDKPAYASKGDKPAYAGKGDKPAWKKDKPAGDKDGVKKRDFKAYGKKPSGAGASGKYGKFDGHVGKFNVDKDAPKKKGPAPSEGFQVVKADDP